MEDGTIKEIALDNILKSVVEHPMPTVTVPDRLCRSQYWRGLLHIFSNCESLKPYFTTSYVDVVNERVFVPKLKKLSAPWSESEKFMLNLALHLFNPMYKINLNNMDYLDDDNFEIAMDAIRMRYRR